MPVPALCSCCARSVLAAVWVTLAQTMVLQCPGPASALQLAAWGLPCHQQGHGESASDLKGTHQALRAGWALQAWHRRELATPAPQNSGVCACPLALTASPPHPTASDRAPGAGACCCQEALPLDWCQLCQVLVPNH